MWRMAMPNFGRCTRLHATLVITALLALSACTSAGQVPNSTPSPAADQPSAFNGSIYGGNVQRTGVYDGGSGPKFGDRLWKYKAEYALSTDVVVSDGLAFLGVLNYGLHAIDIKTGEVNYTLDSYRSVPTVADGVLYYGYHDGLHAMDLATRSDNWVFNAGGGSESSPAVYDGVVYFGGRTDLDGTGEREGYLFAVDVKTGLERWRFPGGFVSAPAIGEGLIYFLGGEYVAHGDVANFRGVLFAVDLQTGKEVWRNEPADAEWQVGTYGNPIYYDGLIYSANSYNAYLGPGHVYAFDGKTGKEVWKQTTEDELWNPETPVAYNGSIYVAARSRYNALGDVRDGPLYVFDARTGKPKWTFRAGSWVNAPAISNGTLYLSSGGSSGNKGALYSLDPETGEQLDMIEFEDALTHSPVISDGVVYVAGHSYEPVLEDVLIAVATLPAPPGEDDSGASIAATATPDR
jgi:outer membrane protein assembly factor BamB